MRKLLLILFIIFSLFSSGCDFNTITDGRYSLAKKEILTRLKDPDSYKMEYIKYHPKFKDTYKIKYRAKNSFGGYEIGYAYAFFNENGTLKHLTLEKNERPQFDMLLE